MDPVATLRRRQEQREERIKACMLEQLSAGGEAYIVEVRDAILKKRGLGDASFSEVRRMLEGLERNGLLASEVRDGPRWQRRYYRLARRSA
jgi:hypothetical protein